MVLPAFLFGARVGFLQRFGLVDQHNRDAVADRAEEFVGAADTSDVPLTTRGKRVVAGKSNNCPSVGKTFVVLQCSMNFVLKCPGNGADA
jgi:hypothetical protein